MKILQLIRSRNFAGSEQYVLTLSRELKRRGHEVFIAVKPGGVFQGILEKEGFRVFPVFKFFSTKSSLLKIVNEHKIDLIHAHLTDAARQAYTLHNKTGVPVVTHLHILREDKAYRRADKIGPLIAVSKDTANFYTQENGYPAQNIHLVPNSTAIHLSPNAQIDRAQARKSIIEELDLPSDSRLVIITSRVAPSKGHDITLDAWADVKKAVPNAQLLAPGNNKQKPKYVKRIQEKQARLGLDDSVHFLGFRDDIPRLVRSAELQLVPSDREPFGLVVIEAMMLGTPVIGSQSGALPEILTEGETGWLHEFRNYDSLAKKIIHALEDEPERAKVAQNAYQIACEKYLPEPMVDRILKVYDEAFTRNSR